MRNFDDVRRRGVLSHDRGRGRIVDDHRPGRFRDSPQHGVSKVLAVAAGSRAIAPQCRREVACPFAVVIDELFDVLFA